MYVLFSRYCVLILVQWQNVVRDRKEALGIEAALATGSHKSKVITAIKKISNSVRETLRRAVSSHHVLGLPLTEMY
jgi:hypothetical protein